MKKKYNYISLIMFLPLFNIIAQASTLPDKVSSVNGTILNTNRIAIPYANIISLNTGKGTISNENGKFYIDTDLLNDTNIIRFQCIGYKSKELTVKNLKNNSVIILIEDIYNLDEILIMGETPDVKKIIKNILKNKEKNYKKISKKEQVFIRERNTADINRLKLDYTKNNIKEITPEMLTLVEEYTPKHNQSYSDILTDIYFHENNIKLNPIKIVELKTEDIKQLKSLAEAFTKVFKNTKDDEYWRVKSGIFGRKIPSKQKDSIHTNQVNTESNKYFKEKTEEYLEFASLKNNEQWEFLYKTHKYNFEFIGGTSIKNENVYIIDFSPRKKGLYEGRLYISVETYALIRADYNYASNKIGLDAQAFGLSYSKTNFSGSICFERKNNIYILNYLSFQENNKFKVNRKVAFQKKKKRIIINKKLKEIEIDLNLIVEVKKSIELLVIDHMKISDIEFNNYSEKKDINVNYVNQFDKNLWKNYITIEPTEKMKEYTKN